MYVRAQGLMGKFRAFKDSAAVVAMPLPALDADAVRVQLNQAADDLRFVFEDNRLSQLAQATLVNAGCDTLRRMARFASTEAEVRAALATQLNLDENANIQDRILVADICSVWNDAQRQVTKEAEIRAENRASGHREPPQPRDVKSMRAAYIQIHGKIEPEHTPGRYLVGLKLDELAENDPQIELLNEVSEKGDGEEDILIPELTGSNQLKVRKGVAPKGKDPKDPEELRVKYELICNAWLFAKTRYGSRDWLRGLQRGSFEVLCKYIFGPKVMKIESAPVGSLATPIHPSWQLVLHYQ